MDRAGQVGWGHPVAFKRFIDHRLDTVLTRIQNKKKNKLKGKWVP